MAINHWCSHLLPLSYQQDCELSTTHGVQPHSELTARLSFDRLPLQAWGWKSVLRFAKHTLTKEEAAQFAITRSASPCRAAKCHADTLAGRQGWWCRHTSGTAGMMVQPLSGGDWDVTEPDTHKHTARTCSPRQIHSVHTDAHLKGWSHSGVREWGGESVSNMSHDLGFVRHL